MKHQKKCQCYALPTISHTWCLIVSCISTLLSGSAGLWDSDGGSSPSYQSLRMLRKQQLCETLKIKHIELLLEKPDDAPLPCGWTPSVCTLRKNIGRPAHFQEYAQKAASPDLAARFFAATWDPVTIPWWEQETKTWRRLNQWMPWAFSNYSTWRILKSYRERELIEGIRSNLIQVLSQARIPAYCSTDPWNSLDTSSDTGRCISHLENKALFRPLAAVATCWSRRMSWPATRTVSACAVPGWMCYAFPRTSWSMARRCLGEWNKQHWRFVVATHLWAIWSSCILRHVLRKLACWWWEVGEFKAIDASHWTNDSQWASFSELLCQYIDVSHPWVTVSQSSFKSSCKSSTCHILPCGLLHQEIVDMFYKAAIHSKVARDVPLGIGTVGLGKESNLEMTRCFECRFWCLVWFRMIYIYIYIHIYLFMCVLYTHIYKIDMFM